MSHHEATDEHAGESGRRIADPLEILKEHFSRLTPAEFEAAVAEAAQVADYNRLYSLAKYYEGDAPPGAIEGLVAAATREDVDHDWRDQQFQILSCLNVKWPADLPPEQKKGMADMLIRCGESHDLYQAVESKAYQFDDGQFSRLIERLNSGYNVHRNKKLLVERYWPELAVGHLVAMVEEAVETKRRQIPEALAQLNRDYNFSVGAWEMSHGYNEPRPEPFTEEEKREHIESVCSDIHALLEAIAEKGDKELPPGAIDLLIREGDRAGRVLRAVALWRGSQLSPVQRGEVKERLGAAELLSHLVDHDASATDWIKSEIKSLLQADPVALAKIFSKKMVVYLDSEDISLIVAELVQKRREYGNWKPNLCSSLLDEPEQLSDEEFYAVYGEIYDRNWCGRHADFFTPERLKRFLAHGPRRLVIDLVNQGILKGDEQLAAALEKCGGHPDLIERCGHLFENGHVDDLIRFASSNPWGVQGFVKRHPGQVSIRQFCEIIRRAAREPRSADLEHECVRNLSESVDRVVEEAEPRDLDLLFYEMPSLFTVRHVPELLGKVESPHNFIDLLRRFVKELELEQLDACVDVIKARRRALDQREASAARHVSHTDLDEGICIIIRTRDDLGDDLIRKFVRDHLRVATARALFKYLNSRLLPEERNTIADKFAHAF